MVVPLERLINMNTQKFKNINSFNLNVSNTQFVRKITVRAEMMKKMGWQVDEEVNRDKTGVIKYYI